MERVMEITHIHRDIKGAKIGMWLFLFSELLFFGGLFLIYSVFRYSFPEDFAKGSRELNLTIGTINTIVLLSSSLTVALSIAAFEKGKKSHSLFFVFLTIFFALLFLVNKYFEWSDKIKHGIYPGSDFLTSISRGEASFFNLYYVITGIHGLHVLIGVIIFIVMFFIYLKEPRKKISLWGSELKSLKGKSILGIEINENVKEVKLDIRLIEKEEIVKKVDYTKLFNAGLYWHFVDIAWIFIFPLFYLI
ncbi:MAG: cytochrome c oxidase subunit 3 [candidate division WOR-3 bacterium]